MKSLLAGVVALACLCARASAAQPSLIVNLVDDLGWADLGCYGSEIPTLDIDALAVGNQGATCSGKTIFAP